MTSLDLFDYPLPENLVAQRPAEKRDASRLMLLNRNNGGLTHKGFNSFPDLLKNGDVLVINTTKVFPARLLTRRETGAKVELLLVRRHGPAQWEAYVGGLKKIREGEALLIGDGRVLLTEKLERGMARFSFESESEELRLIEKFGQVPLPPYIRRPNGKTDDDDRERYQTVYATNPGSCAAPTAGLHFTEDVLKAIRAKGVQVVDIILHVGPGTFKPVKVDAIENHNMDQEQYEIHKTTAQAVNEAKASGRRVIAVGSTVTRALEGAVSQSGLVQAGGGSTSLYITPGFPFRVVDALLTNFHLPKSTLLILVSAFAGREFILKAYEEAVKEKYRFYSYGDAMFIE